MPSTSMSAPAIAARIAAKSAPAWTTISSVRGWRRRIAAASSGGTYDDVSAGVRSRGAGCTTTTRASAGRRSGSSPASSRTRVTERSATSRASATWAAERTTSIGGCSTPPSRRRSPWIRSADARMSSASNSPRAAAWRSPPSIRGLGPGSPIVSSRSTPARIAAMTSITWASPCGSAPMLSASVIVSPRKPRSSRIRSCITARDSVAGREASPVTAGSARCADITTSAPGLDRGPERDQLGAVEPRPVVGDHRQLVVAVEVRARRGPGSACRRPRSPSRAGRARSPRTAGRRRRARSPNERIPRCGLAGLSARSQTGAYETFAAHRQQLEPGRPPDPLGQVLVARRAQRHVAGERRRAVAERVQLAALLVGGDQQGRRARVERRRRRAAPAAVSARTCAGDPDVEEPEQRHPGGRRGREAAAPTSSGSSCPSNASIRRPAGRAGRRRRPPASTLDGPRQAAHEVALRDDEEQQDRDHRHRHARRRSSGSRPRRSPGGRRGPPAASSRHACGASATATGSRSTSVTNVKIATAASDGRTIGSTICHQIRNSLAPSTRRGVEQVVGDARGSACRSRKMLNALTEVREDQRRQRVVVVEDVHREHEARDVRQLGGHDQRRQQRVEDRAPAREPHLRQRVRGQRGDQHVEQAHRTPTRSRCSGRTSGSAGRPARARSWRASGCWG